MLEHDPTVAHKAVADQILLTCCPLSHHSPPSWTLATLALSWPSPCSPSTHPSAFAFPAFLSGPLHPEIFTGSNLLDLISHVAPLDPVAVSSQVPPAPHSQFPSSWFPNRSINPCAEEGLWLIDLCISRNCYGAHIEDTQLISDERWMKTGHNHIWPHWFTYR